MLKKKYQNEEKTNGAPENSYARLDPVRIHHIHGGNLVFNICIFMA